MASGPLGNLQAQTLEQGSPSAAAGYGPLVPKPPTGPSADPTNILALPAEFNYQVIDRQGLPQRSNGTPGSEITPGIFDAMGAFPDAGGPQNSAGETTTGETTAGDTNSPGGRTILIRNHENRERPGEIKVVTGPAFEYDETTLGGCTKLVVERRNTGEHDPATDQQLYEYEVVDKFNILGGTSTNCAGGEAPFKKWITCEEVVKGPLGTTSSTFAPKKHGYNFEVDAMSDGPVEAVPILAAGRFVHEATTFRAGILYQTEDRRIQTDPVTATTPQAVGQIGACLYRYTPDQRVGQSGNLAETTGPLEALAVKGSPRMNMDEVVTPGATFEVEWVPVPEPDHEDDTDNRRDRAPGFTPTRIQAIDNGAAFFDRQEGIWASSHGAGFKIYFDCTEGGPQNLGQVWEYDPGREVLTLIYISTDRNTLENPDNITIVPQTQDIFLCEDSPGEQFIRGVTQDGEIYNFAEALTNDTEFCGACFDPDGQTLYVNQQGQRGTLPGGPNGGGEPDGRAVTYAIYGPFEKREGANNKNFGTGPAVNSDNGSGDSGNGSRR
jgi:hypothetical protein